MRFIYCSIRLAHGISTTGMVEIFKQMGDPAYIVYQPNKRYVEIVRYRDQTGKAALASVDFYGFNDKVQYKYEQYMNGYSSGLYNVVVTTFNPDDLAGYLTNPANEIVYDKQKGLPESGSGSKLPSHLTDKPFYEDIVPQNDGGVKGNDAQRSDRLTEPSTTSTDITEEMRQRGEKAIETATAQREAKVVAEQKTHRAIRAALTSLVYDKKLNGEQLEKARNVDSESAGLAASFINNRAFKDTVPQAKAKVKTEDAQKSDRLTEPSTREILATALEGTAKTELEQKVIDRYYLYCNNVSGFLPRAYMLIWVAISFVSIFLAYICWYARGKGIVAIIISSIIIGVFLHICLRQIWFLTFGRRLCYYFLRKAPRLAFSVGVSYLLRVQPPLAKWGLYTLYDP